MDTLTCIAPHLQPYFTISGLADYTYTYKARTGSKPWQGVQCEWHRKKISGGSWLYVATDSEAGPARSPACRLLYVGSQTADRMFRGDFPSGHPLKGRNFHHAQLRNEGSTDDLLGHLRRGGRVHIHVVSGEELTRMAVARPECRHLLPLTGQATEHTGYWFEQAILAEGKSRWAWNARGVDPNAEAVLRRHGLC